MMKQHILRIGERIYDEHDDRWGEILLIGGKDEDRVLNSDETDVIILYKPDDSFGECETLAGDVYPYYGGGRFQGMDVCEEIYDTGIPYYVPEYAENVYEVELDK